MRDFSKADLPEDWSYRHGEAVIREFAKDKVLSSRKALRKEIDHFHELRISPTLTPSLLSATLPVHLARRLFNRVAFCYCVKPTNVQYDRDPSHVGIFTWLAEAFEAWTQLCSDDAKKDHRMAFATVNLQGQDLIQIGNWLGVGEPDSVDNIDTRKAQDASISQLIVQHRQLCDLVQARAYGPAELTDEFHIGPQSWTSDRLGWYYATCAPVCRAVILLAPNTLDRRRSVTILLTGDNAQLKSKPPTLDSIPAADIFKRRADHIVEVALETAVRFLHRLDIAEESANDDYRRLNTLRRGHTAAILYNEAAEHVGKFRKTGDDRMLSGRLVTAMLKVMGDEIA